MDGAVPGLARRLRVHARVRAAVGVKVFAFFAEVGPRGGGTLVIPGSHRVLARFLQSLPPDVRRDSRRCRTPFLTCDPWLRALSRDDGDPDRAARFMNHDHRVDGVDLHVQELTGGPGDVVLTHPWVLHCPAPNTAPSPRMMLTKNLYRRDAHPARADDPSGHPGKSVQHQ